MHTGQVRNARRKRASKMTSATGKRKGWMGRGGLGKSGTSRGQDGDDGFSRIPELTAMSDGLDEGKGRSKRWLRPTTKESILMQATGTRTVAEALPPRRK